MHKTTLFCVVFCTFAAVFKAKENEEKSYCIVLHVSDARWYDDRSVGRRLFDKHKSEY